VLDESNAPFFKWFADGKLNASYNCLDRNVEAGLGDKVAIVFEADDGEVKRITYKELLSRVSQFANGLRSRGIKKGDRGTDLHVDGRRGHRGNAGLCAYRRHSLGGLWRFLGAVGA
jgi:hypothetical protein